MSARLASAALFSMFTSLYLLKAVRDEMAMLTGIAHLGHLFTGSFLFITFLALALSLFHRVVWAYWLLIFLVVFLLIVRLVFQNEMLNGLSFMILSTTNLLIVSQFWAVMLRRFSMESAKHYYPKILLTGGLGVLIGPWLVMLLSGRSTELLASLALFFLIASGLLISSMSQAKNEDKRGNHSDRKTAMPLRMTAMIFIYSVMGTLVYAEQLDVLAANELTQAQRLHFFGKRDFWIGLCTTAIQWVNLRIKTDLLSWTGFQWMPLLTWLILLAMGIRGSLEVVLWSMIIFRSINFAFIRPAREACFFEMGRGARYKTLIDTVGYRAGDLVGIWLFQWWHFSQWTYTQLALSLLPLILIWFIINQKILKSIKLHHE